MLRSVRLKRIGTWLGRGTAMLLLATTGACVLRTTGDPTHIFAPSGPPTGIVAIYFSGDLGMRFGVGSYVAPALAKHGIPTVGKDSGALFRTHRTREQAVAIVTEAVESTIRDYPGRRIVVIGQSYGSDIVATTLPDLPVEDRPHIAGVIITVPGREAYFRADPLGLAYLGDADAQPAAALRAVRWTPIACIQGATEKDSLCPHLAGAAHITVLPGGHFLKNNYPLLVDTILARIAAMTNMTKI